MNTLREKFFSRITEDFNVMSQMVIKQINLTQQLLENNQNGELQTLINNNERILDSLDLKMRNEVINVIVLYSPRAADLRKIMSYYDLTTNMERIGDQLLNVAEFLGKIDLKGNIFTDFQEDITQLLTHAETMVKNALLAFTYEDINLAQETITLDDIVDSLHDDINTHLHNYNCGRSIDKQQLIDILCISSISYNIERIGDNATNIAEAAIYTTEGKDIKHRGNEKNITLLAGSEG